LRLAPGSRGKKKKPSPLPPLEGALLTRRSPPLSPPVPSVAQRSRGRPSRSRRCSTRGNTEA
jgi:hypothetical protein